MSVKRLLRSGFSLSTVLVSLMAGAVTVAAQAPPPAGPAPAATKPAAPAQGQKAKQPAATNNEAALQQRVDQLEEQLVDLQVVIGTLESLAKQPAAQAPPSAGDAERIQALEAQLKSLSAQIEQMGEKARSAGEPSKRSDVPPPTQHTTATPPASPGQPSTQSFGSSTVTSSDPAVPADRPAGPPIGGQAAAAPPSYETQPGAELAPIGSEPQAQPPAGDMAALPPSGDPGDPKHDYEVAYSHIIQRDYGAAQAGFTDFMKRYPKDALVPNALYWLGETHYQQRNFADAAEAFDLVTKLYASSPKAADSQLKRALSYSALGKNNEACAALSDLNSKFQNAPAYVKTRAGSERRRLGCTG